MKTTQQTLSILVITFATALLLGCASRAPSTTTAPPETPEIDRPASEAAHGEGGESRTSGESVAVPGEGTGSAADQATDGSAGEASSGDTSSSGGHGASASAGGGQSGAAPPEGAPETADEAAAALDRQLSGAIEEYDRHLRQEMQRLAGEAEDAAHGGSQGADSGSANTGSTAANGGGSTSGETTGGRGDADAAAARGEEPGSVGGSGAGAGASDRIPADVGDGSDDDIVARQLREAAIAEDDPELREKLWDEYRRYKASVGGSAKADQ